MTHLTFLGAAGTVTGSRYLLDGSAGRLLVDCGLFQGLKALRLRNRDPFPVPPRELDAVVLTHAHLDHSGFLPVLVRDGFDGPVYATAATCDLCEMLLLDSAHLLEEEAEYANRHGYSKHHPALPLYTTADAEAALGRLRPVRWPETVRAAGQEIRFRRAGHILGAAIVEARAPDGPRVVFSGDLGRPLDTLMHPPASVREADYLVVESTYGDRLHEDGDPQERLGEIVRRTAARGGVLVVPAFAVGRAQVLLHHLWLLRRAGDIPALPVFVDSPMACQATALLETHAEDHRLGDALGPVLKSATFTESVEQSKAIDERSGPFVVISASGMATGGRVLFHLKRFAPDRRNTILLVGHQAVGTRGEALARGERQLKIHGQYVPVAAEVSQLDGLSAHADADEIMRWLGGFERAPRTTFVTHGEPGASAALARRIERELGWRAHVPAHGESVALD